MSEILHRKYQLNIGDNISYKTDGVRYPLQLWASIEGGFSGSVGYAEIRVHNLNRDDTAAILALAGDPRNANSHDNRALVRLQAGYPGLFGPIFTGRLINAIEVLDLPERYITLYCRDSADEMTNSVYSKTHATGSTNESIILDAAKSFGLPVKVVGDLSTLGNIAGGATEFGNSKDVMDGLARAHGFEWTISDSTVIITTEYAPTTTDTIKVSTATGMIGDPEFDRVGVEVKSKIRPDLKIGKAFEIESLSASFNFSDVYYQNFSIKDFSGVFTAKKISYDLDFYGDTWDMSVKGWRNSSG